MVDYTHDDLHKQMIELGAAIAENRAATAEFKAQYVTEQHSIDLKIQKLYSIQEANEFLIKEHIKHIDSRVEKIDNNISRFTWLLISGLILGAIGL